jgi:hypothetical protein
MTSTAVGGVSGVGYFDPSEPQDLEEEEALVPGKEAQHTSKSD